MNRPLRTVLHVAALLVGAAAAQLVPAGGRDEPLVRGTYVPAPGDILIADFEGTTYGDWQVEGAAFGPGPGIANVTPHNRITGQMGQGLVNTYLGGDGPVGVLTSPEFTLRRRFLCFQVGGGNHVAQTCMDLLVDGRAVRSAIGPATKDNGCEIMAWVSWDVAEFEGQTARLRIVDAHSGGWGHINIDHIVQSNRALKVVPSRPADAARVVEGPDLDPEQVELGSWHRIGPFRDKPPLTNWMENVASSFRHTFTVEAEARASDGQVDLTAMHAAPNFPATPDAIRRWTAHPDWIDGYYQELPRGPAPSAGETQFLYRTLTTESAGVVEIDLILRSPESDRRMDTRGMEHWRRTGRYAWMLNGEPIARWEGRGDMPRPQRVALRTGVNCLFAKITNNRHAYGFAFALKGVHPDLRHEVGFERMWRPHIKDLPGEYPHVSEQASAVPGWVQDRPRVTDAVLASLNAFRDRVDRHEVILADLTGQAYPEDWQAGGGFGPTPRDHRDRVVSATTWDLVQRQAVTGSLVSPWFRADRPCLLFHVGGGFALPRIDLRLVDRDGERTESLLTRNFAGFQWVAASLEQWQGRTVRIELVDGEDSDGWGWVALREIRLCDHPYRLVDREFGFLGATVCHRATSAQERYGAGLLRPLLTPADGETLLRLTAAEAEEWLCRRLGSTLTDLAAALDEQVRQRRYAEALQRLRGVESAARDRSGRVVPAMEAALAGYPTSPAGDRHRARLMEFGRTVQPLLARIDRTGVRLESEVFAAASRLERLWDAAIAELPPLVYLQRPTYVYDSMMYEGAGTRDAAIKSFDPVTGQIETIFDFSAAQNVAGANEISLSWDGRTIYIGGNRTIAAVDRDGDNYRRITSGQSPRELPDGRLVFFDTDVGQAPCKSSGARRLLFICDADGSNRKLVSANTCIDTAPTVMNDGRVIFTRWDYGVNKNVFNRHALWTQNPDGTGIDLYFGNTVVDPRAFCRPHQIPGRPEVLTIFGPHHAKLAGLLGLVWNGAGTEAQDGLGFRRITHDTASVGDRPESWSYQDPYPLNEQLFLVSFGGRLNTQAALYLYDRAGNRTCLLASDGGRGIHSARPFVPRNPPPRRPDRSVVPDWEAHVDLHERLLSDPDWDQRGTLFLQDVYQGVTPEIERGRIKYLAVMEQPAQSHGRGGAIGVGTIWYVNRVLGLVPVEADGSAHFEVPALRSIYFHVLDEHGRMLMTQGSDFHVMPGETRGCVGCHEQRKGGFRTPSRSAKASLAMAKPPVRPTLPDWGTRGIIEYETVVQPVLDRYCVKCHSGTRPKHRLDLTGDLTTAYSMSYMQLTDGGYVHFTPGTGSTHAQPSNDCDEQAPLSRGSVLSKLADVVLDPGHCGTAIPFNDRLKVLLWIDSNVPFFSHYRQVPAAGLSDTSRRTLADVHIRRCASCHDPRRPMPDEASGLNAHHIARHVGGPAGQWGIAPSGMRVRHLNLSDPDCSAALRAPLAKEAGGWGLCKRNGRAIFQTTQDEDCRAILNALETGVVRREGIQTQGIAELLKQAETGNE